MDDNFESILMIFLSGRYEEKGGSFSQLLLCITSACKRDLFSSGDLLLDIIFVHFCKQNVVYHFGFQLGDEVRSNPIKLESHNSMGFDHSINFALYADVQIKLWILVTSDKVNILQFPKCFKMKSITLSNVKYNSKDKSVKQSEIVLVNS